MRLLFHRFRSLIGIASASVSIAAIGQSIPNPSFESQSSASLEWPGYSAVNDWTPLISGLVGLNPIPGQGGPFADNGAMPDGSNVAFIQSQGQTNGLTTTVSGLIPGTTYQIGFRYSRRSGYDPVVMTVVVDGNTLLTTNVTSSYSQGDYSQAYPDVAVTFTALATQSILTVTAFAPGDGTLLLDAFAVAPYYIPLDGSADYQNRLFSSTLPLIGAQPTSMASYSGGVTPVPPGPTNGVFRELWPNLAPDANGLYLLTNTAWNPNWPDKPDPAFDKVFDQFETDTNTGMNHYGQRLRSYVLPPQTGPYTFWIASDDNSALFLSTDDTPANAVEIAFQPSWNSAREYDNNPTQQSAPISLQAGQLYYVEADMQQGEGGDNLSVQWQLPDGTLETPIPANRLVLQPSLHAICNSSLTLSQVGFGQPVASVALLAPTTGIGGMIIPAETNLVGLMPDSISPSNSVVWIPSAKSLIAATPGFVTVQWGSVSHQYLISALPAQNPVAIYWNQTVAGGGGGPPVNLNSHIGLQILYNNDVPPQSLVVSNSLLYAFAPAKGLVTLVYTNTTDGTFQGLEVVQVRNPDIALSQQLVVTVGTNLVSFAAVTNPGPTFYRYGLDGDPSTNFLCQLALTDPAFNGFTFVCRPTTAQNQINVFWTQTNRFGMAWPYEMDSYSASWPADFEQRAVRVYLTEDSRGMPTTSPIPDLSTVPVIKLHYNDEIPPGLASSGISNLWLNGKFLHASTAGRALLHYENAAGSPVNGFLGVQFVDVVPNTPDNVLTGVPIAEALTPVVPMPDNLPGLATRGAVGVGGNQPSVFVSGFVGSTYQQIFPVRPASASETEVFWFRHGLQGTLWPYEMDWFGSDWPTDFTVQSRRLYLTDNQSGTPTTAPTVDLSAVPNTQIHYNSQIPPGVNSAGTSTNLWLQGHFLHASVPGRILLHYENVKGSTTNGFLGFQMVDIRPNTPDNVATNQSIGTALQPFQAYDTPSLPGTVTQGRKPRRRDRPTSMCMG